MGHVRLILSGHGHVPDNVQRTLSKNVRITICHADVSAHFFKRPGLSGTSSTNHKLNVLLTQHIIKTNIKLNQSNSKTVCKACVEKLGEEEGKKKWFPNKKDQI